MNSKHRKAQMLRLLGARPMTINEVAKSQRIAYNTARKYLAELHTLGAIENYNEGHNPIRYYIPFERL